MIVTNIISDRMLCIGPGPFSYCNWKIKIIYLRKNCSIRLLTGLKNHGGLYFSWLDTSRINTKLLLMLLSSPRPNIVVCCGHYKFNCCCGLKLRRFNCYCGLKLRRLIFEEGDIHSDIIFSFLRRIATVYPLNSVQFHILVQDVFIALYLLKTFSFSLIRQWTHYYWQFKIGLGEEEYLA